MSSRSSSRMSFVTPSRTPSTRRGMLDHVVAFCSNISHASEEKPSQHWMLSTLSSAPAALSMVSVLKRCFVLILL